MTSVNDYAYFNCFGVIRADPDVIFATGTVVLNDGHSIEHSVKVEEPNILPDLAGEETAVILFAAHLSEDGKVKVATQNLSARTGGVDLSRSKDIAKVVHKLMKKFL